MSKARNKLNLCITETSDPSCDSHDIYTCQPKQNRKEIARKRWGLLAKALKSPLTSQPSSPTDEISMRRFSTFNLLSTVPIPENSEPKSRNWYRYFVDLSSIRYYIDIGHMLRPFTAQDLMGFNNTGNICVWPSEEALAFYILNNLQTFRNKTVLELGAGMSALSGLLTAKYSEAIYVNLTDGNSIAVDNIQASVHRNSFRAIVNCSVLKWEDSGQLSCGESLQKPPQNGFVVGEDPEEFIRGLGTNKSCGSNISCCPPESYFDCFHNGIHENCEVSPKIVEVQNNSSAKNVGIHPTVDFEAGEYGGCNPECAKDCRCFFLVKHEKTGEIDVGNCTKTHKQEDESLCVNKKTEVVDVHERNNLELSMDFVGCDQKSRPNKVVQFFSAKTDGNFASCRTKLKLSTDQNLLYTLDNNNKNLDGNVENFESSVNVEHEDISIFNDISQVYPSNISNATFAKCDNVLVNSGIVEVKTETESLTRDEEIRSFLNKTTNIQELPNTEYDIILSADCLFFDDSRKYLIETLWKYMREDSMALVMAPRRGNTLELFVFQAELRGFNCEKIIRYNGEIWEKHLTFLKSQDYDEDIHYPILLRLTKG